MLLTWIFVGAAAVQLVYWAVLRRGFSAAMDGSLSETSRSSIGPVPISVVVAARDEEARLPLLLEALARQTHPDFEVIVVDDGSTDATVQVATSWQERLAGLRLVRTAGRGKKQALEAGIDAAAHDLLAFTDADCVPPPGWLETLSSAHRDGADCVVVGYSPMISASESGDTLSGRLLVRVARYETFVTGFLSAAAIGLCRPYMAVGRNLSYPRRVFRRVGGFAAIERSLSGDDDLFLQEVVRGDTARVVALLDPRSYVRTEPPGTWRAWIRQKRRHASGGRFYRPAIQLHLTLFHATGALLWLAPLLVGWMGVGLLAAKLLVQGGVLRPAARILHEDAPLLSHILLEPLYVLYHLTLAPIGIAKIPKQW